MYLLLFIPYELPCNAVSTSPLSSATDLYFFGNRFGLRIGHAERSVFPRWDPTRRLQCYISICGAVTHRTTKPTVPHAARGLGSSALPRGTTRAARWPSVRQWGRRVSPSVGGAELVMAGTWMAAAPLHRHTTGDRYIHRCRCRYKDR